MLRFRGRRLKDFFGKSSTVVPAPPTLTPAPPGDVPRAVTPRGAAVKQLTQTAHSVILGGRDGGISYEILIEAWRNGGASKRLRRIHLESAPKV